MEPTAVYRRTQGPKIDLPKLDASLSKRFQDSYVSLVVPCAAYKYDTVIAVSNNCVMIAVEHLKSAYKITNHY